MVLAASVACTLTGDGLTPERVIASNQGGEAGSAADAGAGGSSLGGASGDGPVSPPPGDPGDDRCDESMTCVDVEPPACDPAVDADCGTTGAACELDDDCASRVCDDGACAAPGCEDSRRNADETDVDCGGSCTLGCPVGQRCGVGGDCETLRCVAGICAEATCDDDAKNQDETDEDCGGSCPPCAEGQACRVDGDCESGTFCPGASSACTTVRCDDQQQNGGESDVDCGGGSCQPCADGASCAEGTDCSSGVCDDDGACAAPGCDDGVRNQAETDVDCGGGCGATCAPLLGCATAADCASGVCDAAGCPDDRTPCCQEPSCADGVQNGDEPVVDCGNEACGLCPLGSPCTADEDCVTESCDDDLCENLPCRDGVQNGAETDVDCGGTDPVCEPCAEGQGCQGPGDCAVGACTNGVCANCFDGQQGGSETDVDCGGVCGPCPVGAGCAVDADCQGPGACEDEQCCGGNREHCTRCALRLAFGLDCNLGGDVVGQQNCEAMLACMADNADVCAARFAPGCSEPGAACDANLFGGNGGPGLVRVDSILGTAGCVFD